MQTKPTSIQTQGLACPPGTLAGGLSRTRFFDGMFLTQADLENEQTYWRMKRRMTNRALGNGVVWGLRLGFNDQTKRFRLSPGYALDCCGNDLIVECPVEIAAADLLQASQAALGSSSGVSNQIFNPGTTVCVVLQYVECPDCARPVHRDACSPPGSACEPSRVRESCRLLLVPECDVPGCDAVRRFVGTANAIASGTSGQTGAAPPAVSAKQTIGTWLDVALHGYLNTAEQSGASAQAQLLVSYLLSSVTSGLLETDVSSLTDAQRQQLSAAVNQLSSELCEGLLYPGPRCHDEHHGVYLGCARLVSGTIVRFDPWSCRREVLTGPLVNWWLCQLGIPPLDVLVNTVADDACSSATIGKNNGDAAFGNAAQLTSLVDQQATGQATVSPLDFIQTVARALVGTPAGTGLVKVDATAPNGKPMSIVVPAGAVPAATASPVGTLVDAQLVANTAVQPLSRAPLRDLVSELAMRTPIAALATGADPASVTVLDSMTVADLIAAEPEAVLAKLGGTTPTDAQRAAVNALYVDAEAFVRSATSTAAGAAKAGVTRAQLTGKDLQAALVKVTGATQATVSAAAAAAAKR